MYTRVLLLVVVLILGAFFYLHTQNPAVVTFIVTKEHTYILPVTLILFAGFLGGVIFAIFNSLAADARRAIKDMRARKERRVKAAAEENFRRGVDALSSGETSSARGFIEKAIKVRPADTAVIKALSETYVRENKPREALRILEEGFYNNSNSIGILISISKCASDVGDGAKAAKALEEVLKIDPKSAFALKKLRDFKIEAGLWPEAAALQKTVVDCEHDENSKKKEKALLCGVLYECASVLLHAGKLPESIARVKEALRCDEAFMPAYMLLGDVLYRQGSVSAAVRVWEKAYGKYPDSEPLMLRIEDALIRESAPDSILERYRMEVISNPGNINMRLLLARLYLRLEMVDDAIEELERMYMDGDETFYPQVLLAEAYLRRKQSAKAAHLFQKALGLDRELLPPFVCSRCGAGAKVWLARCNSCGDWNTLAMKSSPLQPGNALPS